MASTVGLAVSAPVRSPAQLGSGHHRAEQWHDESMATILSSSSGATRAARTGGSGWTRRWTSCDRLRVPLTALGCRLRLFPAQDSAPTAPTVPIRQVCGCLEQGHEPVRRLLEKTASKRGSDSGRPRRLNRFAEAATLSGLPGVPATAAGLAPLLLLTQAVGFAELGHSSLGLAVDGPQAGRCRQDEKTAGSAHVAVVASAAEETAVRPAGSVAVERHAFAPRTRVARAVDQAEQIAGRQDAHQPGDYQAAVVERVAASVVAAETLVAPAAAELHLADRDSGPAAAS